MVLLNPDGTVLELNRKEAAWRDPDTRAGDRHSKIWDAPTLQAYPQHIPMMKRAVAAGGQGRDCSTRK